MVLGGAIGWVLDDKLEWKWQYQLALYLIPTVIYGVMYMGQKYPKSEAAEKGLSLGEMFKDVGILGGLIICYLLVLFFQGILPADYSWGGWIIGGGLLIAIAVMTGFAVGHWLIFVLFIALLQRIVSFAFCLCCAGTFTIVAFPTQFRMQSAASPA